MSDGCAAAAGALGLRSKRMGESVGFPWAMVEVPLPHGSEQSGECNGLPRLTRST
jgi:hypothetical protein